MVFSPLDLPPGVIQLITDELASPADYILHQLVISHSKEQKHSKRIILSVSQAWARWQAIALKNSVNLTQQKASGSLLFIDVGIMTLKQVYRDIVDNLSPGVLVILDDVSTLEWTGTPVLDIVRFCRALRAQCLKSQATLVIRHHITVPDSPDQLFQDLLQLATYHVDVKALSSGRSGAVSGEVALHLAPNASPTLPIRPIPRSRAVQYRLTDSGAVFFERGNSRGVL
ncbi:hypothetical protein BDZ89DRAFT_1017128 [Hymenopellis radicata]|nr:hypothetical protein BDZ89DRAFT_1017128 [Hymenopellis radicata]